MSNIADKMKDSINSINTIKTKLIRSSIWTAEKISECLSKSKDIENINVSDNQDRLYLKMKDGSSPNSNELEVNSYDKITNYTSKMVKNAINTVLNDQEKQYIKEYGLKKVVDMMYHIAPISKQRLVIMDL